MTTIEERNAETSRRQLAELPTVDRTVLYVAPQGDDVTTWTGDKAGRVIRWGARHPFSRERRYIRVRMADGSEWHGTGEPGMYAPLRKCKGARS